MRYETTLSENYVSDWGIVQAVKEFIQNAVYAKTVLGDDISITHDGNCAIIHNGPSGFDKSKLLMGESEQRGTIGAPGNFGEGYKLGMLIAVKLGLKCYFETNGFSVYPVMEPSSIAPEVKVLYFNVEDTDKQEGTTFVIECTEEVLNEALSFFAVLNDIPQEVVCTNSYLENIKDVVYVNGVKITDCKSLLGYNFTNPNLMNRDRNAIDMNLVRREVQNILSNIDDVEIANKILSGIVDDDAYVECGTAPLTYSSNREVWKQASKKVFGDKIAISTGGEKDTRARYHGYTLITPPPSSWSYFFDEVLGIVKTHELDDLVPKVTRTSVKPKGDESTNLGWCKRLVKLYYGDYGTVKICSNLMDGHNNHCAGHYIPKDDVIWIDRSILHNKEELFKTLLHETVHRITKADDNTEEFTKGWEQACWGILNRSKSS